MCGNLFILKVVLINSSMVKLKRILVFLTILVFLLITSLGGVLAEGVSGDTYIVHGEENLRDNHEVIDSFQSGQETYYKVKITGIQTLDAKDDPNMERNKRVELLEPEYSKKITQNIESNSVRKQDESRVVTWNIRKINGKDIQSKVSGNLGSVDVAVIDGGVNEGHSYLNSEVYEAPPDTPANTNHGTHVTGIISADYNSELEMRGVAPGVDTYDIILGPLADKDNTTTLFGVSKAMMKAAKGPDGVMGTSDDAEVISMSFKAPRSTTVENTMDSLTPEKTLVASAGNENGGPVVFPGSSKHTIAVASTDRDNSISSFSSTGSEVDIAAPGNRILSTGLKDNYALLSGTSMAAPHVSAAVAALQADTSEHLGSKEIKNRIKRTSIDLTRDAGGSGLLDIETLLSKEDFENKKPEVLSIEPKENWIAPNTQFTVTSRDEFESPDSLKVYTDVSATDKDFEFDRVPEESRWAPGSQLVNRNFNEDLSEFSQGQEVFFGVKVVDSQGAETIQTKEYKVTKKEFGFKVTNVDIPKEVKLSESKQAEVSVVGIGSRVGIVSAGFSVGEQETERVGMGTLDTGETGTAVKSISPKNPGDVNVEINIGMTSGAQSEQITREIFVPNDKFNTELNVNKNDVEKNKPYELEVILENKYTEDIDYKGELTGDVQTKIERRVESGSTERIIINQNANSLGTKSIDLVTGYPDGIKTKTENINVLEPDTPDDPTPKPDPPDTPDDPPDSSDPKLDIDFEASERYLRVGEETNLVTKIENNGDFTIFNAVYKGDGIKSEFGNQIERSKTLGSGEIGEIKVSVSYDNVGEKELTLSPGHFGYEDKQTTIQVNDNKLFLEELDTEKDEVYINEKVNISYVINNTGDSEKVFRGSLLGSNISQKTNVNVNPGLNNLTETIKFETVGDKVITLSAPDRPTIESKTFEVDVNCIKRRQISRGEELQECRSKINGR